MGKASLQGRPLGRTLLPKPQLYLPHGAASHSSTEITATLLASDDIHEEWFAVDSKVILAFRTKSNNLNANAPSEQEFPQVPPCAGFQARSGALGNR